MTTLIPKFDFKNGGATPAGALNRPINQKLADTVAVSDFDGADAGAQIIAAIASLPATGGVVDGTMLQGTQVISSTISIGSSTRPVTLLLSHGATLQPATASLLMFHVKVNGQLIGATIDTTNVTYASTAVLFDGEGVTTGDGNCSLIQDLIINGTVDKGTGLQISTSGTSTYGIAFLTINQIRIVGYYVGVNIYTNDATQFINGNSFNNIEVKGSHIGFNFSGNGDINANQFMSCTFEASPTSVVGFNFTKAQYNTLLNTNVWDMPVGGYAYSFSAVTAVWNRLSGYLGGSAGINPGNGNVVLDSVLANLPVWGEIQSYITPSVTWGLNFAPSLTQSPNLITFAIGGLFDLAQGSGIVVLHSNTTGNIALFLCAAGTTTLISDPSSSYSTTIGTVGRINFAYNLGTTSYRIQNALGSIQSIYISLIKTRYNN